MCLDSADGVCDLAPWFVSAQLFWGQATDVYIERVLLSRVYTHPWNMQLIQIQVESPFTPNIKSATTMILTMSTSTPAAAETAETRKQFYLGIAKHIQAAVRQQPPMQYNNISNNVNDNKSNNSNTTTSNTTSNRRNNGNIAKVGCLIIFYLFPFSSAQ